jgi:hypothetical protein
MDFVIFLIGSLFGIFLYIYIPKWFARVFEKIKKQYDVTLNVMYFHHPVETTKKGEFLRMKPITIKVDALDEEEAIEFASHIVRNDIKIEIDSIEENG